MRYCATDKKMTKIKKNTSIISIVENRWLSFKNFKLQFFTVKRTTILLRELPVINL